MNAWVPVVLGVAGAALSALAAWAIARRQRSGTIETTEAQTLWSEGQAMRQELRAEAVVLREEVQALRSEAVACRDEAGRMRVELLSLRQESVETHKTMATLREECAALHAEIVALREQMVGETAGREALTARLDEEGIARAEEESTS